jgi:hypothetical protein
VTLATGNLAIAFGGGILLNAIIARPHEENRSPRNGMYPLNQGPSGRGPR